jgi:prepilin-type N-terminal cleavage/methylation domain-containing protein
MIRHNGFTLVELLAAMAAGSLLLVALGAATASLSREARQTVVEKDGAKVTNAAALLEKLIGSLQPGQANVSTIHIQESSLTGDIDPPAALGSVGPLHMALEVQEERDGAVLMLTFTPVEHDVTLPPAVLAPIRVAGGFQSIRFDTPGQAKTAYRSADGPITIAFAARNDETRILAFRPKVTTGGDCRFDPISLACR